MLRHVKAGEPVAEGQINAMVDAINQLRGSGVGGGGLGGHMGAGAGLRFFQPEQAPRAWLFQNFEFNSGGTTSDGVRYWLAHRMYLDSDDKYTSDTGTQFTLYDPLNISTQFATGDCATSRRLVRVEKPQRGHTWHTR